MKPLIGITAKQNFNERVLSVGEGYVDAVIKAGGIPYILPISINKDLNIDIINIIDGLILTGGEDIDGKYFNEDTHINAGNISPFRDEQEVFLAKMGLDKDIPMLGICRGIQVMNIAADGDIYQDMYSQLTEDERGRLIKHDQSAPKWYGSHKIKIEKKSKLYNIFKKEELFVNSFHHQAVRKIGNKLVMSATTNDNIIEGIESIENKFAIGVQWHPELMWQKDECFLLIFRELIKKSTEYRKSKKISYD